jgi:hypothetical protein
VLCKERELALRDGGCYVHWLLSAVWVCSVGVPVVLQADMSITYEALHIPAASVGDELDGMLNAFCNDAIGPCRVLVL